MMSTFALFALALLGIHRLWHYEEVFSIPRRWTSRAAQALGSRRWLLSPVLCPRCSPIWFGIGLVFAWPFIPYWLEMALAAYPILRLAVWLHENAGRVLIPHPVARAKANMRPVGPAICTTCPSSASETP